MIPAFVLSCRLRALSSGGSVTSPPPSPAMPKYKLAEYRYGREEMLALYIKDNKVCGNALGKWRTFVFQSLEIAVDF